MSFFVFATLALAMAVDVSGLRGEKKIQGGKVAAQFVKSLEFKRRLRVCNAYPYPTALDVYRGSEHLTEEAMSYKTCRDFDITLSPGDKLVFKVGNANAGTFSVSDLPNNDSVLLLVIYRHDTLSTAVSFESHVYANLLNAQVAVVDTYKGTATGTLKLEDHADSKTSRSEELRFDSVVAVNPGKYEAILVSADGTVVAKDTFVALNRESYILMRSGVEAQEGSSYPQELVVYPRSDESLLGSASLRAVGLVLAALLLQ